LVVAAREGRPAAPFLIVNGVAVPGKVERSLPTGTAKMNRSLALFERRANKLLGSLGRMVKRANAW
jgi:hypothetical protein